MFKNHTRPDFGKNFFLFLLLNLCFFSLQLLLVYSNASSFVSAIALPWRIYQELFLTLGVHLGLYLLLSLIQTQVLITAIRRTGLFFSLGQWQIGIWILFASTILLLNAYYFPLSLFSELIIPPVSTRLVGFLLILPLVGLSLLIINGLLYLRVRHLLYISLALAPWISVHELIKPPHLHHSNKPNIIILGIDSLSLERVDKINTPFIYQELQKSVQFKNTISPLARTFPAWCSILTGLYPNHHRADENLISKQGVKKEASIAWTLHHLGYTSIFASDDRRFNNLDRQFGFDQVIGPKLGVNDVLLGTFNDFPLSNLLINLPIGARLFPYNHMNRASFFSYYPQTFTTAVQHALLKALENDKPMFVALHLTLPHWPYTFANSIPELVEGEFSHSKRDLLYQSALVQVDQQVASLFHFIKQQGLLNNSLIIMLSDHGETLFDPNSRLTNHKNYQGKVPSTLETYFKSKTATPLNKSVGHGSDILSPEQYHSMLGFYIYKNGHPVTKPAAIPTRTALIDIAPTIMAFLQTDFKGKIDGISLLASILKPDTSLPQRSFFIESGMLPNQDITKEKTLQIGHDLYKINPDNGEIELKPSSVKQINKQKLYGIIRGDWILALYPDETSYINVLQNLKTGQWVDDLDNDFAKIGEAPQLLEELRRFYGSKLVSYLVATKPRVASQ